MFDSEINFGHHLHSIRLILWVERIPACLRNEHFIFTTEDWSLSPLFSGKSSKSRICVGAAKEFSNEFQQFGDGRELSDSGASVKVGREVNNNG